MDSCTPEDCLTCNQGRACPARTDDEPGLLVSPAFWIGGFLSICAWSVAAFVAIAYFN